MRPFLAVALVLPTPALAETSLLTALLAHPAGTPHGRDGLPRADAPVRVICAPSACEALGRVASDRALVFADHAPPRNVTPYDLHLLDGARSGDVARLRLRWRYSRRETNVRLARDGDGWRVGAVTDEPSAN